MSLATIYSRVSPKLRDILLRRTSEQILNIKHNELRQIDKKDIITIFDTLDYSEYITGNFHAIVADPPWPYQNRKTGGSMISAAAQKYNTMKIDDLKRLGPIIKDLTMNHPSLLFLWVTTNFQNEAMELVNEWGYVYKTKMYWIKPRLGMGFWFRNKAEELWVCVSKRYENQAKAFHFQTSNIINDLTVRGHSSKPFIRGIVSEGVNRSVNQQDKTIAVYKLELFARKQQMDDMRVQTDTKDNKTWKLHGEDIDKKNIHEALISTYYNNFIRNFARMRRYKNWIVDAYDLAYLQNVLNHRKNRNKKRIMTFVDNRYQKLTVKENGINHVLETINAL